MQSQADSGLSSFSQPALNIVETSNEAEYSQGDEQANQRAGWRQLIHSSVDCKTPAKSTDAVVNN